MGNTQSFADVISHWQQILAACADNAPALTSTEPQRLALEKMLKDVLDLKALQDSHRAAKQESRQKLDKALKDGREAARRLQNVVKGNIGTDNERLVQFNSAPLRPRGPRKKKDPVPAPVAAPATPGGTPPAHQAAQAEEKT